MSRNQGPTADEIERDLVQQIESVVTELYPGAVIKGGVAYCSATSGKDLGSFQVYLKSGRYEQGSWHRWSQGVGGNVINLIAYALTGTHKGSDAYREAFQWAKRFLGIVDHQESPEQVERRERLKREAEAKKLRDAADAEQSRQKRLATAGGIWKDTKPISGTLAEIYLIKRGIPGKLAHDENIRFHPALFHEHERDNYPALVAKVSAIDGKGSAVWRIFLDSDGTKARIDTPKMGLGEASGGAVRLGGMARKIGVAEGVETALACMAMTGGKMPVWALLSTSGMIGWEVPVGIDEVIIFADADNPRVRDNRLLMPGQQAAAKLDQRLQRYRIKSSIVHPPIGMDFLDLWNKTNE